MLRKRQRKEQRNDSWAQNIHCQWHDFIKICLMIESCGMLISTLMHNKYLSGTVRIMVAKFLGCFCCRYIIVDEMFWKEMFGSLFHTGVMRCYHARTTWRPKCMLKHVDLPRLSSHATYKTRLNQITNYGNLPSWLALRVLYEPWTRCALQ